MRKETLRVGFLLTTENPEDFLYEVTDVIFKRLNQAKAYPAEDARLRKVSDRKFSAEYNMTYYELECIVTGDLTPKELADADSGSIPSD